MEGVLDGADGAAGVVGVWVCFVGRAVVSEGVFGLVLIFSVKKELLQTPPRLSFARALHHGCHLGLGLARIERVRERGRERER